MIGGINCPPVEAAASTPPANFGWNPARFISGMVITPVEAVLATAEPEIVPVSPEAMIATMPGPPTIFPAMARARLITNSPAPDRSRKAPKMMKRKTVVEEMRAIVPNIASSPKIDRNATVSTVSPGKAKTPPTNLPQKAT